jgi:hypothetical protein
MQHRERCGLAGLRILRPEIPIPRHRVSRQVPRKKWTLAARRLIQDAESLHVDPELRNIVLLLLTGRHPLPPGSAIPFSIHIEGLDPAPGCVVVPLLLGCQRILRAGKRNERRCPPRPAVDISGFRFAPGSCDVSAILAVSVAVQFRGHRFQTDFSVALSGAKLRKLKLTAWKAHGLHHFFSYAQAGKGQNHH